MYIGQFSYNAYNLYVMFYYEIPWFYQDFKSENLCFLNMHLAYAARMLDLSLVALLTPPN